MPVFVIEKAGDMKTKNAEHPKHPQPIDGIITLIQSHPP
jgi:hypothetical protein